MIDKSSEVWDDDQIEDHSCSGCANMTRCTICYRGADNCHYEKKMAYKPPVINEPFASEDAPLGSNNQNHENEITSYRSLFEFLKEKYDFSGFYRYEGFDSFVKIMQSGWVKSRSLAAEDIVEDYAHVNIIENTINTNSYVAEYARFFFRPLTPYSMAVEGYRYSSSANNDPNMSRPVLICMDWKRICEMNGIAFSEKCLGAQQVRIDTEIDIIKKYDWNCIFSQGAYGNDQYVRSKRDAEFLILSKVSTDYIKKVYFRSYADLQCAEALLGKNSLFCVKQDFFWLPSNSRVYYDGIPRIYLKEVKKLSWSNGHLLFNFVFDGIRKDDFRKYSFSLELTKYDGSERIISLKRYVNMLSNVVAGGIEICPGVVSVKLWANNGDDTPPVVLFEKKDEYYD